MGKISKENDGSTYIRKSFELKEEIKQATLSRRGTIEIGEIRETKEAGTYIYKR